MQVVAAVELTNKLGRQVGLSADDFRLLSDRGADPVEPVGGSMTADTLPAGTRLALTVRFVVPRDGASLWLQFREPGQSPARVALGTTDSPPGDAAPSPHGH